MLYPLSYGGRATPKGTSRKPRADTSRVACAITGPRDATLTRVTHGLGRVLVVDDDEVIRRLIAVNLQLEGFEVETAVDGQDCLDKVTDIEPDVITLDVMMPRLDGWETAVQLRRSPDTAHIKVVLITARAQEDDKARGARVGADAYLTKPFDPNEMIRVVRELAGREPAVITAELRRAILAAAGHRTTTRCSARARSRAATPPACRSAWPPRDRQALAARLATEPWIATAEITGPGYLTVTVTHDALAGLAVRIARAGPACAASDALRGRTAPGPAGADLAAAPDWPSARAALAAELTARLAAAAGATVTFYRRTDRRSSPPPPPHPSPRPSPTRGATRSGSRWPGCRRAASRRRRRSSRGTCWAIPPMLFGTRMPPLPPCCAGPPRWDPDQTGSSRACSRHPTELALLDALSWLPERVAMAARRGRPDEFAGYLEELAARTIDTMSTTGFTTIPSISSERLWLADAARTGLAAGLGLLGVGAPERI